MVALTGPPCRSQPRGDRQQVAGPGRGSLCSSDGASLGRGEAPERAVGGRTAALLVLDTASRALGTAELLHVCRMTFIVTDPGEARQAPREPLQGCSGAAAGQGGQQTEEGTAQGDDGVLEPNWPWLVWLSGLSAGLRTKGLLVQFPVRALPWVAGRVPSRGRMRGKPHADVSLPPSPSLPLSLKLNK